MDSGTPMADYLGLPMTHEQIRRDVETVRQGVVKLRPNVLIDGGEYQEAAERLASLASRLVDLPDEVREAMEKLKGRPSCDWTDDYNNFYVGFQNRVTTLAKYFLSLTEDQ